MNKMYGLKFVCTQLVLCLSVLTVQGQGADFGWVKRMGSNSAQAPSLVAQAEQGNAICVDKDGNVYTTGTFAETADFDPGPGVVHLVSAGEKDIFVAKTDPTGALVWAIGLGGVGNDEGMGIAADTAGNVYITGMFSDTVDFSGGNGIAELISAGEQDMFVTKLDPSGEHVWTKQIGGDDVQRGNAITVDQEGNIYTTGFFCRTTPASTGVLDFDPGPGEYNLIVAAYNNAFILKLDAAGNFVWVRQVVADNSEGYGLAVSGGAVYTNGGFSGNADLNPDSTGFEFVYAHLADVYIVKLDTSGDYGWSKILAGNNDGNFSFGFPYSLAVDAAENVYSVGVAYGEFDFDPDASTNYNLSSTGYSDGFISKLDSAGNFAWAKMTVGSFNSMNFAYAVRTDAAGNVYTTGEFSEASAIFNDNPDDSLVAAGNKDVFVTKLAATGELLWAKSMGSTEDDQGRGIAVDQSGNVYTTGFFKDVADFDPGAEVFTLAAEGSSDIFLHKFVCADTSAAYLEVTACSFTFNGTTYTTSGIYTEVIPNSSGCDSTITIDLTIDTPNPIITVDGFMLGTTMPYESYQWNLDGTAIPGAVAATYTITQNGDYSVDVVNASGCAGISAVYTVTNYTGIHDATGVAAQITVYPNPAHDIIQVKAPVKVGLTLLSIDGRTVRQQSQATYLNIGDLADGVYLLQIRDESGVLLKTEKLSKQPK